MTQTPPIIGFDDQGRVVTAPEAPAQTMRERLIAKLMEEVGGYVDDPLHHPDELLVEGWINPAQVINAILAELRKPDEAMHDAGSSIIDQGQGHPHDKPLPTMRNAFTAMIDAVREGK